MRIPLYVALVVAIAVGGGGASVWFALNAIDGLDTLRVGVWTAYPDSGTPQVDPYGRARIARDGELPLGRAEGLYFLASRDSSGQGLRRRCRYRIEGGVPVARFWTLYAADRTGRAAPRPTGPADGLHSRQLLRRTDNSFEIAIGRAPAPGNWLAVKGTGEMVLVLTLYDTPVANGADARDIEMPAIYRTGCDA
ncbi:DUF1214 domain-containing protein [Nitratireductor sp. CAU 1489]|uniref:DUF1214 domain-containing protein n=1 Tax=Nitratireductor arenosus TaxID=2682096 RepID=A0A844QP95_9HYPH|nr:DUF1214 domain-containing protein [Nitratireductor arenosus]MVA99868.1 DUF1214 domain-containing protein [Nitratireductor arenosus]